MTIIASTDAAARAPWTNARWHIIIACSLEDDLKKLNRRSLLRASGVAAWGTTAASAQRNSLDCACVRASDGSPLDTGTSELRPMIERFFVELRDLERVYPMAGSSTRHARLEKFYSE